MLNYAPPRPLLFALLTLIGCTSWSLANGRLPGEEPSGQKAPAAYELSYVLRIPPDDSAVAIEGLYRGPGAEKIRKFNHRGIRGNFSVGVSAGKDQLGFRYRVAIEQKEFLAAAHPVRGEKFFAGFLGSLLLLPDDPSMASCKKYKVTLEAPEKWKVATSIGADGRELSFTNPEDLLGTLVCCGDYTIHSFPVENRTRPEKTEVLVALRGERKIDEKKFYKDFRRLVEGQMRYFDGNHPAPRLFLALHFTASKNPPRIPAFNRRTPAQDTILAIHPSKREYGDFEFLGMLAHEHLHNWYPNVQRSDLGPWFMEGLNDYVAYLGLLTEGIHTRDQFSGMLSKWYREYLWCQGQENHPLVPYRRGMLAAWIFDMEIHRATGGKKGLRDLLVALLHARPADAVVSDEDFLSRYQKVSGKDGAKLYEGLVQEKQSIFLRPFLEGSGFRIAPGNRGIVIDPRTDEEKAFLKRLLQSPGTGS